MIKIKELHLKGFKDPDREVNIKFSDEPVTIIYGENGSGKTTLLRVIQAIFKDDIEFLKSQNIQEFTIVFDQDNIIYTFSVDCIDNTFIDGKNEGNEQLAEKYYGFLQESNSALFGVNRGTVEFNQTLMEKIKMYISSLRGLTEKRISSPITTSFAKQVLLFVEKMSKEIEENSYAEIDNLKEEDNHAEIDNLSIQVIEKTLRQTFDKGQNNALTSISNSFFSTIDNAINLKGEIALPQDFTERFFTRKPFFQSFIEKYLQNSPTKEKLKLFLETDEPNLEQEGNVFKALLKNMLEAAEKDEKENLDLKAINTLISIFNEFVIHQKKLNLSAVESSIDFPNGQKHQLSELSSGERHLLSFLTIFLIIGRGRNFFLIDEPEISLSVKWQRRLLELLSEFSPNSQIIVATHSPAIANKNYKNQVELI